MSWKWIILATVAMSLIMALVLAVGGFLFGAGVPDENAGEAALFLAGLGAVVGGVVGAVLGFVPMLIIRLVRR